MSGLRGYSQQWRENHAQGRVHRDIGPVVEWGDPPRMKVLRRIEKIVKEHRIQLLAEWETNVNK